MTNPSPGKRNRLVAAGLCLAYILIQCFQEYVFKTIPEPTTDAEALLQGAMPLHLWRSLLLLLSFFAMVYILAVIIIHEFKRAPLWYSLAAIGFLTFCCLEITIRSVEYFYIQHQLPTAF